jgi:hypothetical protein
MPGTGELEQFTGGPFWGSEGGQEGQKEVLDGGEAELSGADSSGRGGQGRRCSPDLGKSRGGAATVWGGQGWRYGPRGDGWGGLNQRGGSA